MKRLLVLTLVAILVGAAIWFALRANQRDSSAAVLGLLPRETVALAIVPDLKGTRAEWTRTDLYAIWQEPAVQEFLRKPRATMATNLSIGQVTDDLERLEATEVFIALIAPETYAWNVIGGFRFKKNGPDAEKILESWRSRLLGGSRNASHATSDYEQHRIETDVAGKLSVSTTVSGDWFFAASDVAELKRLLDRVDHREKDAGTGVVSDENFAAAYKKMPKNYAALIYGRPDRLANIFISAGHGGAATEGKVAKSLAEVRSFCASTWFDGGKMRDRTFVAMPKKVEGTLTRSSLDLCTKETFLYFNMLADSGGALLNGDAAGRNAWAMQPIATALAGSGITPTEWNAAFASEFSIIGEWPTNSRWPSAVATVPVKDAARAQELAGRLSATAEAGGLTVREEAGVRYFSAPATGQLFSVSPTIAISDRWLVLGLDTPSVEAAMLQAKASAPALTAVATFQTARATVPNAQQSFAYLDSALVYTRFDAALRPMMLMSAAFVPGINDAVDLGKFPAPEIITRHLSPIAMSQSYADGGYLAESVGPVTLNGLTTGVVALAAAGTSLYQQHLHGSSPASFWTGQHRTNPKVVVPASPPASTSPSP